MNHSLLYVIPVKALALSGILRLPKLTCREAKVKPQLTQACFNTFMPAYVYIMGNHHLHLYIGVTTDLIKRVNQHKSDTSPGHTKKYKLKSLLYYETHQDITQAIIREKQLKKWKREWKLSLIRSINPSYQDLYPELT